MMGSRHATSPWTFWRRDRRRGMQCDPRNGYSSERVAYVETPILTPRRVPLIDDSDRYGYYSPLGRPSDGIVYGIRYRDIDDREIPSRAFDNMNMRREPTAYNGRYFSRRGSGDLGTMPTNRPSPSPSQPAMNTSFPRRASRIPTRTSSLNALPFGKAMKELHRQLGKAQNLYTKFQNQYEEDTKSIQNYASLDILKTLWIVRAKGKRFQRGSAANGDEFQNQSGDGAEDDEIPVEKLRDTTSKVGQALQDALNSSFKERSKSRKQQVRAESARRLQQKIDTATGQIMDLLHSAIKGQDYCKALLVVIELLKFGRPEEE